MISKQEAGFNLTVRIEEYHTRPMETHKLGKRRRRHGRPNNQMTLIADHCVGGRTARRRTTEVRLIQDEIEHVEVEQWSRTSLVILLKRRNTQIGKHRCCR